MSEGAIAIITAIIAGALGALGSFLSNVAITMKKSREQAIKDAQREQWQEDQFEAIKHKLDVHNGYAEKLGDMSRAMVSLQKDVEYLKEGKK